MKQKSKVGKSKAMRKSYSKHVLRLEGKLEGIGRSVVVNASPYETIKTAALKICNQMDKQGVRVTCGGKRTRKIRSSDLKLRKGSRLLCLNKTCRDYNILNSTTLEVTWRKAGDPELCSYDCCKFVKPPNPQEVVCVHCGK